MVLTLGWALLSGCSLFDKAKDKVDGVLNPTVVQGIVLGVEPPSDPELAGVLGGDLEVGTSATFFLASASKITDIENAPIVGAVVELDTPDGVIKANEQGSGLYTISPTDGPDYVGGEVWTVSIDRGGEAELSMAALNLPPAATADVPRSHAKGQDLVIDLTGQPFDAALVMVLDAQGNITYSNEPQGIKEIYDFTHGNGGGVGAVTIPGTAFADDSVYAVGIAGMVNTTADDLDQMNTALSTVMVGDMVLFPTSTIVIP